MEKILNIEEIIDYSPKNIGWAKLYNGYQITTDKQSIIIAVSNEQACCENWGYLVSEDDFDYFIGASLLSTDRIGINDVCPVIKDNEDIESIHSYGEETMAVFINVNTDRGLLQFAIYNAHNGYYGHSAIIISDQLTVDETI